MEFVERKKKESTRGAESPGRGLLFHTRMYVNTSALLFMRWRSRKNAKLKIFSQHFVEEYPAAKRLQVSTKILKKENGANSICSFERDTWYAGARVGRMVAASHGLAGGFSTPLLRGCYYCSHVEQEAGRTAVGRCNRRFLFVCLRPCIGIHIISVYLGFRGLENDARPYRLTAISG